MTDSQIAIALREIRYQLNMIKAKLDALDLRTLPLRDFGLTNQVNELEQRVRALEERQGK